MSNSLVFVVFCISVIYAFFVYFILSKNAKIKIKNAENKVTKYSSLSIELDDIEKKLLFSKKQLREEDRKFSDSVADLVSIKKQIEEATTAHNVLTDKFNNTSELLSKTRVNYTDIKKRIEQAANEINKIEKNKKHVQSQLDLDYKNRDVSSKKLTDINNQISTTNLILDKAQLFLSKIKNETKELQQLKRNSSQIIQELEVSNKSLASKKAKTNSLNEQIREKDKDLHSLMSKIDLYVRLDDFIEVGFFEKPEYLYETSLRFAEEIKRNREKQKEFIKNKVAITYPDDLIISDNATYNKQILNGQIKLMLTSFNVECDTIISKISPSNFSRTLERIDNLATSLEKSAATLYCGFNIEFVELKYEESKFQYQFKLKKQEEQEEQSLIREQIREEQKALKEYDKVVAKAEKEARIYKDMLEKARAELSAASDEDRNNAEQRISSLEQQLIEIEAQKERALSMAEQTKKGHVYVISNIGSFGDGIYKIGLTRRLEPLDRVKELGGASVPFIFDVHAMIYAEDAPALERSLHKEFTSSRVNAVNLRKEFFKVDLQSIKQAVKRIAGTDAEFKTTILANEYYETRRLQKNL